jgi:hypothetical protein
VLPIEYVFAGSLSSCVVPFSEQRKEAGFLFHNFKTMLFDNIPHPYPCEKLGIAVFNRHGEIDCLATDCPFKKRTRPLSVPGANCVLRGAWAAKELEALGETQLAERLHAAMPSADGAVFGRELLRFASNLQKEFGHLPANEQPVGSLGGRSILWAELDLGICDCAFAGYRSPLGEIVEAVEEAGRWYKQIASFGCDVDVWVW